MWHFMNFIIDNWYIILALSLAAIALIVAIVRFFKSDKKTWLANVKEWLLYATTLAEKELGGGTGKLKLRYVYDMFVVKFPWLAKIISFEYFSSLVDETLGSMNDLLTTNNAVQLYVNGPNEEPDDLNVKG